MLQDSCRTSFIKSLGGREVIVWVTESGPIVKESGPSDFVGGLV